MRPLRTVKLRQNKQTRRFLSKLTWYSLELVRRCDPGLDAWIGGQTPTTTSLVTVTRKENDGYDLGSGDDARSCRWIWGNLVTHVEVTRVLFFGPVDCEGRSRWCRGYFSAERWMPRDCNDYDLDMLWGCLFGWLDPWPVCERMVLYTKQEKK